MTVSTDIGYQRTSGDGVTTIFGVSFALIEAAQLVVELVHKTTGEISLQVLGVNYTLEIAGDNQSASITMLVAPPATHWIVRRRAALYTQPTHLLPHGPFPADLVELAIDRMAMNVQAIRDGFRRGIRFNDTDPPNPNTLPPLAEMLNRYVYVNGDGDVVGVAGEASAPVSGAWAEIVASVSLEAGLTLLGFSDYMKSLRSTASLGDLQTALGISPPPKFSVIIDNAGCEISQVPTNVNLTGSPAHSPIDRFSGWASGGTVSAGTMQRDTAAPVGRSGRALKLAGVTITGSGQLSVRQRIEALTAARLRNVTASFAVKVRHDLGSAIDWTVVLRKPTALDDFSSTTTIATSPATSVPSGVDTQVLFEEVAMGDVTNGLEIEVRAACGAVTTKNFWLTEFVLTEGNAAPAFAPWRDVTTELQACQRFWESGNWSYNEAYVNGSWTISTQTPFKTVKRAVPTCTVSSGTIAFAFVDSVVSSSPINTTSAHFPFTWTADARFAP